MAFYDEGHTFMDIKSENKNLLKYYTDYSDNNSSKRIINYCKGGYNLIKSSFCSMSDLLDQANDVAMHGNIPTCRRAIRLLNMDIKIPYTIEVKMSNKIKRELELKKQLSLMYGTQGLIVKKGKVIVEFD